MEEFKLQFYFNLYKNTSMDSRNDFRAKFHKRHGEFRYLNELIRMIENYQIKTFGCTLHEGYNSRLKQQTNAYLRGRERNQMEGGGEIMNNVYINLKDINSGVLNDIFNNQDLVSIEELVDKLEDYYADIEKQQEEIDDLKEYKNQYCELYDQYCR